MTHEGDMSEQHTPEFPPFEQHPDSGTFATGQPNFVMLTKEDYEYMRIRVNACASVPDKKLHMFHQVVEETFGAQIKELAASNAALKQQRDQYRALAVKSIDDLRAFEQQRDELQAKCDVLVADVLDLRDDFQHAEPAFNRIELMIAKAQEAV